MYFYHLCFIFLLFSRSFRRRAEPSLDRSLQQGQQDENIYSNSKRTEDTILLITRYTIKRNVSIYNKMRTVNIKTSVWNRF